MTSKIYCDEMSEEIKEEVNFLYKVGITPEELNYLIGLKLKRR